MGEANHILRLTLDFEASCTAEEAKGATEAVLAKIDQCWAETTSGPIHDEDGRHVGNATLEKLPVGLQMASAAQLRELVCRIVRAIPRVAERPEFPDDYVVFLRVKVGDLRAARRFVPALDPNATGEDARG